MRRHHQALLLLVPVTAFTLAACGSATPTVHTSSGTTSSAASEPATSAAPASGGGGTSTLASIPTQDRSQPGTSGTAPTVVVPSGAPPTQLESADLITGTGATAKSGDSVTVQYVLATYSSGKVIQSSWTGQPFTFTLGAGQVIPGWDTGVVGMMVGGRRELIIPPKEGYGANSPGAGIAVNDTLVFVIDLLKVSGSPS